jgi:nanoRNase/pAp phosphatase (c-di-AMP/oligoRNAs hydrolase)
MTRRLVLGFGAVGRTVVGVLSTWPGELHAVVDDEARARELREDTVAAEAGDPTDPDRYPDAVDTVFVALDDATRALDAARAVRGRYPDALLVSQVGIDADAAVAEELAALSDRTVPVGETVVDAVVDVTLGDVAVRLQRLRRVLSSLSGPLAVVTHDNPDPDAIGSALALARIAESLGVDADACYFGDISHQENRALVNLLDLRLRSLEPGDTLSDYGGIALVDHSRPGVNDGLPPETAIDVVVDHHPPRSPIEAQYVDLRSAVGATSTLLADYLRHLDVDIDRTIATTLLYGIRIDTADFTREVSSTDFEAAAFLLPHADLQVLDRVESPSMSPEVLETLGKAVENRVVRGEALATGVGRIRDRDALAQAADYLLNMEGVDMTLVYGFMDDTVYVSGRARGASVDLGETLRDALGAIGSAGGHADMAGAQIPLGILGDVGEESDESLADVIDDVVQNRFFETLSSAPSVPEVFAGTDLTLEFPLDELRRETDE